MRRFILYSILFFSLMYLAVLIVGGFLNSLSDLVALVVSLFREHSILEKVKFGFFFLIALLFLFSSIVFLVTWFNTHDYISSTSAWILGFLSLICFNFAYPESALLSFILSFILAVIWTIVTVTFQLCLAVILLVAVLIVILLLVTYFSKNCCRKFVLLMERSSEISSFYSYLEMLPSFLYANIRREQKNLTKTKEYARNILSFCEAEKLNLQESLAKIRKLLLELDGAEKSFNQIGERRIIECLNIEQRFQNAVSSQRNELWVLHTRYSKRHDYLDIHFKKLSLRQQNKQWFDSNAFFPPYSKPLKPYSHPLESHIDMIKTLGSAVAFYHVFVKQKRELRNTIFYAPLENLFIGDRSSFGYSDALSAALENYRYKVREFFSYLDKKLQSRTYHSSLRQSFRYIPYDKYLIYLAYLVDNYTKVNSRKTRETLPIFEPGLERWLTKAKASFEQDIEYVELVISLNVDSFERLSSFNSSTDFDSYYNDLF